MNLSTPESASRAPGRAVVFPGQGAQAVGMGRSLAESHAAGRGWFDRASEVLGWDVARVCLEGPEDDLTRSDRAQPAIFVVSTAAYRLLVEGQSEPVFQAAAGLSSGEWTALHAAGSISFEDGLRVLEARGRFMQEACREKPGGMISISGLDRVALDDICARAGVHVANLNSPEQTVLSGPVDGIARAESLARESGAKRAIRLNVAGAFHSPLMEGAARRFADFLQGVAFSPPSFPVLSNVTGKPHGTPDSIRARMAEQVTSPVQWVSAVAWMKAAGVAEYVECGPGRVLSGLIKRIDKQAAAHNIHDASSLKGVREGLLFSA